MPRFAPASLLALVATLVAGCSSSPDATSKPTATDFVATPSTINSGAQSTLSWKETGASTTLIDHGVGDVTADAAKAVMPSVTTTYTLTATNAAGSVTATTTVTVLQLPVITSFTATATSINAGQSTTLGWSVTGATSVSIDNGVGAVSGSSKSVAPSATTTYTLTATNAAGSVTATVTVTVTQKPIIASFAAAPANINIGQSTTLSWSVTGAASLSIDNGVGTVTGSSKSVTPGTSTTYTLTATNAAGSATATATVTVLQKPVISSFTATPASINVGQSVTLSWTVTGATSLSIDNGVGDVTSLSAKSVSPALSTTYTLTATDSAGSVNDGAAVNVIPDAGTDGGTPDGGSDGGSNGGVTSTNQWVMGYYVGYLIKAYPIASIDWTGLTHIIFSPMVVNDDLTLSTSFDDANGDAQGPVDARALATAAHAHNVKALLMLGGENTGVNIGTAASPAHLAAFVTELLAAVDSYGYDGIDLDWEDNVDLDNLVALAKALRTARPAILLSYPGAMINGNYQTADPRLGTLSTYLDRFNVQSYYPDTAFWGAGSGWDSWFVAPISGVTGSTPIAIDDTFTRLHAVGVPNAKLGMGMAFYAICYGGGITGPRQSVNSNSTPILGGDNNYPMSKFFAVGSTFDTATAGEFHRDATASEPWLGLSPAVNDLGCGASTQYISYDDETAIIAKGTFSKTNGYGGIIIWNLAEGWLPKPAAGGRAQNSLMQALKTGFRDP